MDLQVTYFKTDSQEQRSIPVPDLETGRQLAHSLRTEATGAIMVCKERNVHLIVIADTGQELKP